MSGRYKIIISNNNLYKEVELSPSDKEIHIGTSADADVRLRRELFFVPIDLTLRKDNDEWNISCSDNVYLSVGDVRKILTKKLNHGDEMSLKYQESNITIFKISFVIDFDFKEKDFNIEIDISERNNIKIGGTKDCDIGFADEYLGKDSMQFVIEKGKAYVIDNNSQYGVFVNGIKIDKKKEIFNTDFFSIVGHSFYYKNGKLYTTSESGIKLDELKMNYTQNHTTCFDYPKYNRSTRVQYTVPEEEIEVQQAEQKPSKPKKNLLLSIIPAFVTLFMTVVFRGILGSGGTFVIISAVSMTMGIIVSIINYVQDGKEYKETWEKRIDSYGKYIDEKEKMITESRENELRINNLIYESLDNSINEVEVFGKRIFERTPADNDFLKVYLGKGNVKSINQINFTKQEFVDLEDPLAEIPAKIAEKYKYIENSPVVSDFGASNGVGVIGALDDCKNMLKNMSLDVSIRHFYNDIKLVYILDEKYLSNLKWVRWLHNVKNNRMNINNIACDEESKNIVLEDLYNVLSTRENAFKENNAVTFNERYVVFVAAANEIGNHPVSKYFENCSNYGFTFVFFDAYAENIPLGCSELIELNNSTEGIVYKTENGDEVLKFIYPNISDETAKDIAVKLGAISIDEVTLEGELTKNITMFELLDILSVEDIDLTARWNKSMVHKSLSAPLGVKSKNQIVYLDISDKGKAHGPHGLVAGTTGSGKSEILQTYILSMATLFHPYEVGFVIIDFKGGGMANQFKALPHLIGTITNIDGREINRSLLSIKAELVKRQELFSESGVNHINDYIKLFKAGKVKQPMPHLIMIVDEFAELKTEYPDFMKELISAARIGRTLGVHLILATQKPAGVVDSQIWSNSKFKLCLKVQTKEDSNEVIKTPLAAEIVEPGRAYFQVGNNEIFELFQSAYSGADVPEGNDSKDKTYEIFETNLWGKKELKFTNKKDKSNKNTMSQLQAIVEYVHDYCENHNIEKLPGICLPSLNTVIKTSELDYIRTNDYTISVPIGMYDDPELQQQGAVTVEFSKENVYIVGSAQTGKTVMLQTMLYGLIHKYTPDEVNIYLVDCGSMVLKIFENSNHVGGVVLSNEEEKCKNLFKLLNKTVVRRKKMLSDKGIGNYASYLEAGYKDMPMIVVMIDNMAAFKEYFPDQADEINTLTREAQGVGISFIVTSAASNALNYRVQANFGRKFTLNCNDTGEYSNVLGHCRTTPKENAGCGLYLNDRRILEYQTAIFGKSSKEAERSNEIKEYIIERNSVCINKAVEIPIIPEKIVMDETMAKYPAMFRDKGIVPIGMSFNNVEYVSFDMNQAGVLALTGDNHSRETFSKNFIKSIANNIIFHNIQAIIIDDKYKKLKDTENYGFVKYYTSDADEGALMAVECCKNIIERQENAEDGYDTKIMLIINSADVMRKLSANKADSKIVSDAMKAALEAGAFILLAAVENQQVIFSSSEIMKTVKEERNVIAFTQLADLKLMEISSREAKSETSYDSTMAYRFEGNSYYKIKIFS